MPLGRLRTLGRNFASHAIGHEHRHARSCRRHGCIWRKQPFKLAVVNDQVWVEGSRTSVANGMTAFQQSAPGACRSASDPVSARIHLEGNQVAPSFCSGIGPPPATLMGCSFQYVSERQSHSNGPKRNTFNHNTLQISWTMQIEPTM